MRQNFNFLLQFSSVFLLAMCFISSLCSTQSCLALRPFVSLSLGPFHFVCLLFFLSLSLSIIGFVLLSPSTSCSCIQHCAPHYRDGRRKKSLVWQVINYWLWCPLIPLTLCMWPPWLQPHPARRCFYCISHISKLTTARLCIFGGMGRNYWSSGFQVC